MGSPQRTAGHQLGATIGQGGTSVVRCAEADGVGGSGAEGEAEGAAGAMGLAVKVIHRVGRGDT